MGAVIAVMLLAGIFAHQESVNEEKMTLALAQAELARNEQLEEEQAAAEAAKLVFARGTYIKKAGYYISDLSPAPVVADGCDTPVLTADLSQPRTDDGVSVTSVNVGCQ